MSQGNPLQIIADPRFQMIITRARVTPLLPKEMTQSEHSSWSSASIVSSIDLKTPELELQTITKKSRNRKLIISLSIFGGLLIFIGIILCILLPSIFIKNSSTSTNNGTDTNSVINLN